MSRSRLAVALLLGEPVASEVQGLRRAFGDPDLDRIAPHITLVPPINVAAAEVDAALVALRAAAASQRGSLSLPLGPVATFAPVTDVLYLSVTGEATLDDLRRALLVPPLARPRVHPFVPHVTISGEASPAQLNAGLTAFAAYHTEVVIDRVHLLRQRPDRIWEPCADAVFGPSMIVGRGGVPLELSVTSVVDHQAMAWLGDVGADIPPSVTFAVAARRGNGLVGLALTSLDAHELRMTQLIVRPECRNEGIGGHLLRTVEHEARARAWRRVAATVATDGGLGTFLLSRGWRTVSSAERPSSNGPLVVERLLTPY